MSLERLEYLGLVSRICKELDNHLGVSDKVLAEFIIDIHRKHASSLHEFSNALNSIGSELSESFISILYRIISQMDPLKQSSQDYTIPNPDTAKQHFQYTESLQPSLLEEHVQSIHINSDFLVKKFPGLALPNDETKARLDRQELASIIPKLELHHIYPGHVSNIKDFGAFVSLDRTKLTGLIHISQIFSKRINHPSEHLKINQSVFVKVISISNGKIGLSMKNIDQQTGQDLNNDFKNPELPESAFKQPLTSRPKRLSSPERFEIKQLVASGILPDTPIIDEDTQYQYEPEEYVEIELKNQEPEFLKGQTQHLLDLEPFKIVKNPEGSLNRAAMNGSVYIKERREIRQQKQPDSDSINNDSISVSEEKKSIEKNPLLGKRTSLSIKEQRESLPIFKFRDLLIQAIRDKQLLIVVGDTGSGKTTQLTQYLMEEGFCNGRMIGCTQPRRVAAMSVAKRVSEEFGCRLGEQIGYTIRFEDCTSKDTIIKYMTDGMLLRECLLDTNLSSYSVIILDEAHERTIHTDVLFGLLKNTIKNRPDMKLIVTSATLDAEKFSSYFNNCPIFTIPGRTFPVEILYTKEPEVDYIESSLATVMQIHISEPPGDILLFLTGQEEIDTACEVLNERMKALGQSVSELIVLPVYSALPSEVQSRIFEPTPSGSRKVVIATNIAETSITIDGIYYVIDPGFVKQKAYNPKLGMDNLIVTPISQAQARQRAGRAGRVGPGKCFRLYTESAYHNEMLPTSIPEIQRTNLANTLLILKAMGIHDLIHFDFMDPPPIATMMAAMKFLYSIEALDSDGFLTRLGRKMAEFPLEPPLSKMLIKSAELGCSEEILTIVAMLSVQNIFYRPKDKQAQADTKKSRFHQSEGDQITLLSVYNSWKRNDCSTQWCFENFIQSRSMRRAHDIRAQLIRIMHRYQQEIVSCGRDYGKICRAIASGFFTHVARRDPTEGYKAFIEDQQVYIHPSSALYGKSPEWVIYHELVMTTKEYMREVTIMESKWLIEAAPNFFKASDPYRLSKRQKDERIQPLFNRFEKPNEWRLSNRTRAPTKSTQAF